jgi:hypothetical protein
MNIDFSKEIYVEDKPVEIIKGKVATLGSLCRQALNAPVEGKKLTIEEMVKRGNLAMKIGKEIPCDLSPEDVVIIRNCLVNAFTHAELVATLYTSLEE